jgi:TadE-like protein
VIRRILARRSRAGSISIEVAILMPAFLLLASSAIWLGQTTIGQTTVDLAARNAARAVSLLRSGTTAQTVAENAAEATFAASSMTCVNPKPWVALDNPLPPPGQTPPPSPPPGQPKPPTGFAVPVGQRSSVTYTVTCELREPDGLLGGITRTLQATFTSPLDTYRARS